jgi:hypothetical protein
MGKIIWTEGRCNLLRALVESGPTAARASPSSGN